MLDRHRLFISESPATTSTTSFVSLEIWSENAKLRAPSSSGYAFKDHWKSVPRDQKALKPGRAFINVNVLCEDDARTSPPYALNTSQRTQRYQHAEVCLISILEAKGRSHHRRSIVDTPENKFRANFERCSF